LVDQEDTIEGSLLGDISTAAGVMLLLCLLDGSEAMLGSDQIESDQSKVKKRYKAPTPRCEERYSTIQLFSFIFVLNQSIFTREEKLSTNISIQFTQKIVFTFSFISSSMSEAPTHFPGR